MIEAFGADDHDVICISSIDWDLTGRIHHQIASSLAAAGNRVLFIENTGVRPPGVGDFSRMTAACRQLAARHQGVPRSASSLFIHSPIVVPLPYSSHRALVNRQSCCRGINRWMDAVGVARPVVWTFLPTPMARALIADINPSAVVYYCIDDLASSSPGARRVSQSEKVMFRPADLVFVTSERLRARAAQCRRPCTRFPPVWISAEFEALRQSAERVSRRSRGAAAPGGGLHRRAAPVARSRPPGARVGAAAGCDVRVRRSRANRCREVEGAGPTCGYSARGRTSGAARMCEGFDVGLVPYRSPNIPPTSIR